MKLRKNILGRGIGKVIAAAAVLNASSAFAASAALPLAAAVPRASTLLIIVAAALFCFGFLWQSDN